MNYNRKDFKEILKEENVRYDLILQKINTITGEIDEEYRKSLKKKNSKKGWCPMYKKDMRNALLSIVNHPTAMKVWLFLWDYMRKTGEIDMPTQEYIANRLGTKRQVIGRALKKLRDEKIIEQYKNRWYYNPFLFMVGGMSDKDRYEAQQRWEELFGYYESK